MTWFSATRSIAAVVTADRERVWSVLSDPQAVAEMTPLVRRIDVDGDHWTWVMDEVPGLGISIAPTFTVRMDADEPSRISFTHDPPEGRRERAGVEGTYDLAERTEGTRLAMDLAVRVDLPLNRLAKPAVRTAMDGVLAGMGRGFSRNLLDRLDADQVDVG